MRSSPPWTDSDYRHAYGPTLKVGFADGFYIIRGPGGEIVGSTQDLEEIGQLVRNHAKAGGWGMEDTSFQRRACAGIFPAGASSTAAPLGISLEELGL